MCTASDRYVAFAYNRKEAKDHGEGGVVVGACMRGKRVVVVDDVLTSGKSLRNSVHLVRQAGGTVVGVVVGLTRSPELTSVEGCPIVAIHNILDDV